jgi:large subunit ribosomal protein L25
MKEVALKVQKRDTGKKEVKQVRAEGLIPGICYSKSNEPVAIAAKPLDMRSVVFTPYTKKVCLEIEGGQNLECVLKEVTFDPITDEIKHFDLQVLEENTPITVSVPFVLVGQSSGVRAGGIMQHVLRKCPVTCMPKDLVSAVEVDVKALEIGKSIHIKDVKKENIKYGVPDHTIICSVAASRASRSAADTAPGK